MDITPGMDLSKLNTFGVKVTANFLIECDSAEDYKLLSQDEYFRTTPFVMLGGGSNLLFTDNYKGNIVHYRGKTISVVHEDDEEVVHRVSAGMVWHDYVLQCASEGLWGAENLSLIPGHVGAAAVQNIGAYGAEIGNIVEAVHTIDLHTGSERTFSHASCEYSYRHSIFKQEEYQGFAVYAVDLRLSKKAQPNLSYAGLKVLEEEAAAGTLTPTKVAETVMEIRRNKLPDPKDLPNAGSFFMNPMVDNETFTKLMKSHPDAPYYEVGDHYKIPAAWLIDQTGLKGKKDKLGKVGCYVQQPLVLVNYEQASGEELATYAKMIQDKVMKKFGIKLVPEVRYIGGSDGYTIES